MRPAVSTLSTHSPFRQRVPTRSLLEVVGGRMGRDDGHIACASRRRSQTWRISTW